MAAIQIDGKKYALFPSGGTKEVRRGIWRCARSWWPERLPALTDVELWQDILWPDCGKLTLEQLADVHRDRRINRNADREAQRQRRPRVAQ